MSKALNVVSAAILLGAVGWNGAASAQSVASVSQIALDLTVSISCKNGDATFTVTNKGEAWPGVGNLSVYATEATKLIHNRRMRLGAGQRVTFRVPGVVGDVQEFGLWVDTSWVTRNFAYDAKITCH